MRDISGVPHIRNYGLDNGFNYLIIDLLGLSLVDKKLKPRESIQYFIQAIKILESIHKLGIIHRDIKPDNFLLSACDKKLYLIDFGLSKYYLDENKNHIKERKDKKLIGTAKFTSLNIHYGIEPSRRDDIESLCYTFISTYGKLLPWEEIIDNNKKTNEYDLLELYNKIKIEKEKSLEWLNDIPGEFITLLLYCRKLRFDEKPNYNYIQELFNNLLKF